MIDPIDRQATLNALGERPMVWTSNDDYVLGARNQYDADRLAIETVPSEDIDLSGFSDKLWKTAYERGKAEAERHGHWIYTPTNLLGYACSECGKAMCRFNYCPHCGARMDEVE